MEEKQLFMLDILIEGHAGLTRQGPGSPEMTMKALEFLENPENIRRVADLGCGTGGQTMILAQHIPGSITGVDISPDFINGFNDNAKKQNLHNRVKGAVASFDELAFRKEELDLVWSEGVIDSLSFEKALRYWNGFLKKGGYVAVSCPSWFTDEHPAEVEKFWRDAGSGLGTVADNIAMMQKAGYSFVAAFALPEQCWTDNYFVPREAADAALMEKYPANAMVREYVAANKREVAIYSKYKKYYGYAFYIGRKPCPA